MSQKPPPLELSDFQPVDPWKSSEMVVRSRKLPHLEVPERPISLRFAVIRNSSFPLKHVIW
ncbi:MAG: hypothetical protein JO189_28520 [Deltaproteobacteria bacterium]|nr:hypothetical protein [Deltaproteobacteria bacterium]